MVPAWNECRQSNPRTVIVELSLVVLFRGAPIRGSRAALGTGRKLSFRCVHGVNAVGHMTGDGNAGGYPPNARAALNLKICIHRSCLLSEPKEPRWHRRS